MVNDLMVKAKQIEFLINSLPEPETEETPGMLSSNNTRHRHAHLSQAHRLKELQNDVEQANEEYIRAVNRASTLYNKPHIALPLHTPYSSNPENLYKKVSEALRNMLDTHDMLNEPD